MSRRYSLTALKGFELWLLRIALLLMLLLSGLFNWGTLTSGEIKIKGQSAPARRASEPLRYWFFTGATLLPTIALGAGFVLSFTAGGQPVKRRTE